MTTCSQLQFSKHLLLNEVKPAIKSNLLVLPGLVRFLSDIVVVVFWSGIRIIIQTMDLFRLTKALG